MLARLSPCIHVKEYLLVESCGTREMAPVANPQESEVILVCTAMEEGRLGSAAQRSAWRINLRKVVSEVKLTGA